MNNPRRIQRHLVKAFAAGALLAAAALPMAIATSAGALGVGETLSSATFTPTNVVGATVAASFGSGASGTVAIVGTGGALAHDGGNVTVTTNAPGVTFTQATEATVDTASATFASTAATVPGVYSLTVTDNAGTATLNGAFTVNAAPTITSLSPATISNGNIGETVTITGTGFTNGTVVGLTSTVDGTSMTVSATAFVSSTSETLTITPTNSVTHNPATPGTYDVTATNLDGGTVTAASGFSVTGYGIQDASPSAVPSETTAAFNTTVTLSGSGFEYGATVAFDAACTTAGVTVSGTPTVNSATSITFVAANDDAASTQCDITVTNPITGGNGASYTLADAFGIGTASSVAPTITASSLTTGTALVAGAPSTVVTFTGTGFSQYTAGYPFSLTGPVIPDDEDTSSLISGCAGNSGTSLTCQVTVSNNATSGSHIALLYNTDLTNGVNYLVNAFTVAGPVITSASPAALAVGAPIGTVVTLTGTGFDNTTVGNYDTVLHGLAGVFQYVSATTENFVVTSSPIAGDVTNGDDLYVYSTNAYGATTYSPDFSLTINNAPTVSTLTYKTGSDVGVGATAQTVTITGTGFQTGATLTGFANGNGTADANVTATVTGVNTSGTQITATIAIAAGDANPAVGYKLTNPDGGVFVVSAISPAGLVIGAGPTITAVTPTPALAAATNAFTVTGTGFAQGAVVTATANGTCGTATVAAAVAPATTSTSLTVSCTLGIAQASTTTSLVVTNPDGGSATSAVVLAAATPPVKKPAFKVGATHGTAVAGKTVKLTISGTGFYGQPKITSSAPGTKAVVTKDTGKLLTVRVTTKAGTKAGTKTFTVRLANGKSGKTNYKVKA